MVNSFGPVSKELSFLEIQTTNEIDVNVGHMPESGLFKYDLYKNHIKRKWLVIV